MTTGRQIAREIFQKTLASLDISLVMERKIKWEGSSLVLTDARIDLKTVERAVVIAIGKAAHAMVKGLSALVPGHLPITGVVAAPTPPRMPVSGLRYFVSGHPLPNAESLQSAEAILRLLQSADERTLVIFLLSGGGSALMELPLSPAITLNDVQETYQALVTCGAPIEAMNTVRKHISAVKGGGWRLPRGARRKSRWQSPMFQPVRRARWLLARRCRTQRRLRMSSACWSNTVFVRNFRPRCGIGLRAGRCRRLPNRTMQLSGMPTFISCWGWRICFTRRTMRRRLAVS